MSPLMEPPYLHNGGLYPEYHQPDTHFLDVSLFEFRYLFEKFCIHSSVPQSMFFVDENLIMRAFIRVDQRKLHYKMYHNGTWINELKEAAFFCYWILKYKPIGFSNGTSYTVHTINEDFCLYIILCSITEYRSARGLTSQSLSSTIMRDLLYTLFHRNISYDSMVMIVEALAN